MTSSPSLAVFAPTEELPAEGYEPGAEGESPPSDEALIRVFREAMADSGLVFEIAENEIRAGSEGGGGIEFAPFTLTYTEQYGLQTPVFCPSEGGGFRIDLAETLTRDRLTEYGWSDTLEPEDRVRLFLRRLAGACRDALPGDPERVPAPLVRWSHAGGDSDPVRLQLLGFVDLTDDRIARLLSWAGELGVVLEDAEVAAHGLRETAIALGVIGLTYLMAPQAQAGPFENLFGKNRQKARAEKVEARKARDLAEARRAGGGWIDLVNDAKIDKKLLEAGGGTQSRIVVDVGKQRAYLLIDGRIAIDTPVSTAREGKFTPRGTFTITERVRSGKTSTIYGCEMPYWMRLDDSPVGMHIGDLPGYPASAGCVRLPYSVAPVVFENTRSGCSVKIVETWDLVTDLWRADGLAPDVLVASAD